jgi:hypothetical protein
MFPVVTQMFFHAALHRQPEALGKRKSEFCHPNFPAFFPPHEQPSLPRSIRREGIETRSPWPADSAETAAPFCRFPRSRQQLEFSDKPANSQFFMASYGDSSR